MSSSSAEAADANGESSSPAQLAPTAIDPSFVPRPMSSPPVFHQFVLISRSVLTPAIAGKICEVSTFTFALPQSVSLSFSPGHGDHVKIAAPGLQKPKSYTPTSDPSRKGSFDLTVKIYPTGKVSSYLNTLPIGGRAWMSGPFPHPTFRKKRREGKRVCALAFGIGITQSIGVARAELEQGNEVRLLHANRHREDVVFAEEVSELQERFRENFKVTRVFSRDHVDEARYGRVDEGMLKEVFGLSDEIRDAVRFDIVGSKTMIKDTWSTLERMGFPKRRHALLLKSLVQRR